MINISILDKNFVGDPCSCHGKKSKYINWMRPDKNEPLQAICFFTDLCIPLVTQVKCPRKIAWLMEPKDFSIKCYDAVLHYANEFDYILSYDDYVLKRLGNALYYPWGSSWVGFRENANLIKDKNVSIIASAKKMLEGHKLRHQIIQENKNIDSYGSEYRVLPAGASGKSSALDSYRYSLVIENSRINNYFTEKLIDCMICKTIPIYWGAPNIDKFFNMDGFINFTSSSEMPAILSMCNEEYYNSKLNAIEENYRLAQKYLVSEDWMYENYPFLFKFGF